MREVWGPHDRARVFTERRSYDAKGFIRDAVAHEGKDPEREIERLLADPEAVQVHSRNVAYGCFMFVVTREP